MLLHEACLCMFMHEIRGNYGPKIRHALQERGRFAVSRDCASL